MCGNWMKNSREKIRKLVQILVMAFTNGYALGFQKGTIYQGGLKKFCVPGLNCYSCPGALGSCPIGALQAVLTSSDYKIPYYMTGFFLITGVLLGRFVCGWLCPFGLIQELLYKLPIGKKKKRKSLPGHHYLIKLKYIVLLLFVIFLPLAIRDIADLGTPWFCKLVCPSGTLMGGWTLAITNPAIREAAGWLFTWKSALLLLIILASVLVQRPFCKYLCPLGAVYGLFHPVSLYRFTVLEDKCTHCMACKEVCPMEIAVCETPNSMECIRCGKCKTACPGKAIVNTCGGRSL